MTTNPEQLLIEVVMNRIGQNPSWPEIQIRRVVDEAFRFLIERAQPDDVRIVQNALELMRDFDQRLFNSLMGSALTHDIITAVYEVSEHREAA